MTKVDLITGFLGAGKTTLIRRYAMECIKRGEKIGIIENDHGAINVDLMLLHRELGDKCRLEMVIGGDPDCHRRRLKTKLIAMGIDRMDRVIVEPSGVFDVEEFMDILYEEPLDHLLSLENVITVVDGEALLLGGAGGDGEALHTGETERDEVALLMRGTGERREDEGAEILPLSPDARYILGSQLTKAGIVYLSKMERFLHGDGQIEENGKIEENGEPVDVDPTEINTAEQNSAEMNMTEMNSVEMNSTEINSTEMNSIEKVSAGEDEIDSAVRLLNAILQDVGSRRVLKKEEVVCGEAEKLFSAGYRDYSYQKRQVIENGDFTSLFFFHPELPDIPIPSEEPVKQEESSYTPVSKTAKKKENSSNSVSETEKGEMIIRKAEHMVDRMFCDPALTGLNRLKGFILREDKSWLSINATRDRVEVRPSPVGQPVLIAIGEDIKEEDVGRHLKSYENEYRP